MLENGYSIDCTAQNGFFVGGNGDFHVLPDAENGYFYFLFSNYAGPVTEQGIRRYASRLASRSSSLPRTTVTGLAFSTPEMR